MVRPSSRRSYRLLLTCLLVALVLTPLAGIALASPRAPGVSDVVELPAGADVAVTIEPSALARDVIPGLESRLAQMLAAYRAGNQETLATFSGERHFNLAGGTVRVILEMARSPEAHAVGGPTYEIVALASGKQATIEHAPRIAVRPELMDTIAAAGATYETAYENWVQVLAPLGSLEALSQIAGVAYVRLPFPAQEQEVPAQHAAAPDGPQVGMQTTQGVVETNADHWQAAGYNGTGVNLAVFDFGFTGWETRQADGDLPADPNLMLHDFSATFAFDPPSTAGFIHGTACAEIAYDMAPGATVHLYAAYTEVEFGNAVNNYINSVTGKRVATYSVGWVNAGPYDGTGSINTIVDNAQTAGIFWANSAGNSQNTHYSGTSAPSSNGESVAFGTGDIEGYGPTPGSVYNIPTGARITAFLEWNDWNADRTGNQNHIDYNVELYRWTGSWTFVTGSYNNQCTSAATPTEGIDYVVTTAGGYGIAIWRNRGGGACPNAFGHWLTLHSFLSAGASKLWWYVNNCNSVTIPADGNSAVATGATFWNEDGTAPLFGLEPFSSLGPRNAAGGGNPGVVVNKPDVVAPDGVSTATYGASTGMNYANGGTGFFGTSGAAPHVAGLAADVWTRWPTYTLAQVRSYVQTQALYKNTGGTCGGSLAAATGDGSAPESGTQNNQYGWGRIGLSESPTAIALRGLAGQALPVALPVAGVGLAFVGLAVLARRRRR